MKLYQAKVFQAALELSIRAGAPSAVSLEKMVDYVRSAPRHKENSPASWAADFLGCLPVDPGSRRLLVLAYVPGYQCRCVGVLHMDQSRCDDCGSWPEPYRWRDNERQRAGGVARKFWALVQDRRLFAEGLRLAERVL